MLRRFVTGVVFASVIAGAPIAGASSTETLAGSMPVAVGAVAPAFTLEDQNGAKVTVPSRTDPQPTVLVFYRGYW